MISSTFNIKSNLTYLHQMLDFTSYTVQFQASLFLGITTLLSRTMPTLLLKNKCNCTTIYMKTQCLQTNEMQHCLGKESALGAEGEVERVALIKSLIYTRQKECA